MKGIKALTPRDLQVIRMIAQGTERDAVADELGVSRSSTDTRDRVVRKIRAEMVKSPLGSAEEHTNYVIEQLAAMVHRELS